LATIPSTYFVKTRSQTAMKSIEDAHDIRIDPELEQPELPNHGLVIVSADSVLASKPDNTFACSDEQQ